MAYTSAGVAELALLGVANPGVPNQECIVLRPMQALTLAGYAIAVGVTQAGVPGAKPANDLIFWFPEQIVAPPSWVYVYTGIGLAKNDIVLPNGERAITLFWQRQQTIFAPPAVVPILIHIGSAVVGNRI